MRALPPRLLRRVVVGFLAVLAVCAGLLPSPAAAHPLGNFTVNRYSRLELHQQQLVLVYVVDMAEIPALQERQRMDANGNTTLEQAEQDAYKNALVKDIGQHVALALDGAPLALSLEQAELSFPVGQANLPTLRLDARFVASITGQQQHSIAYQDNNFADRIGWSEVIVTAGSGAQLIESNVSSSDLSNELRAYPEDLLQTPPSVTGANFRFAPGAGSVRSSNSSPNSTPYPQSSQSADGLAALAASTFDGPWGVLLALLAATGLGAGHALAPGHGKTIVAAYLVGTRSTAWHAVFLGLTTTITHTAGVFALGLVTLFVSRFVLPEQLYPWLGAASGLMVMVIGAGLLRVRMQAARRKPANHNHEADGWHSHGFGSYHTHAMPEAPSMGKKPSATRNVLLLGISGGLIPCPSALVVLLGAIALGQTGWGLLLVLAFSLGLAGVLTGVGLALVYARRLFERVPTNNLAFRYLPVASALVVILAGAGVTAQALMSL